MNTIVKDVKHACIVVSSDQSSTELFEGVFGFPSNGGHESHIFNVRRGFEMHACAETPTTLTRTGWPGEDPPEFPPDYRLPRSIIGLTFNDDKLSGSIQRSNSALKLNSFVVPGFTSFDPSVVAIRDCDDHVWLKHEKITRYIPVSNRDCASSFYKTFLGTQEFSQIQNRYQVSNNFDICLLDTELPDDFQNSSLFQQLSHFCVGVIDLQQTISNAFNMAMKPFQMDSHGNRRDLITPTDKLDFGYGSIYLYDPDGNLWEFQNSE